MTIEEAKKELEELSPRVAALWEECKRTEAEHKAATAKWMHPYKREAELTIFLNLSK